MRYQVTPKLEFSIVGQNLLHDSHPEYVPEYIPTLATENARRGYAGLAYKF